MVDTKEPTRKTEKGLQPAAPAGIAERQQPAAPDEAEEGPDCGIWRFHVSLGRNLQIGVCIHARIVRFVLNANLQI